MQHYFSKAMVWQVVAVLLIICTGWTTLILEFKRRKIKHFIKKKLFLKLKLFTKENGN